jgi:DNA polymerase (family X)
MNTDSPAPIPLPKAQALAEKVLGALSMFCTRIEVAGSIRRRRPMCGDIDIVAEPRPGQLEGLIERCKERASLVQGDKVNLIFRLRDGTQLDLFVATPADADMFQRTPGNWGSLLLCRTGSKEHNIYIIEEAKRQGLRWNPYHGVFSASGLGPSRWVAGETEEEIFAALGMEFVTPEKRER